MSAGWGVHPHKFKSKEHKDQKSSKTSLKFRTDRTEDTSPTSRKLSNHKSYTQLKTYKDHVVGDTKNTEIVETDKESDDEDDDNWIGADEIM